MGEQRLCKAKVAGSNPAISTEFVEECFGAREKFVEQQADIKSKNAPQMARSYPRPGGVCRVELSLKIEYVEG